MLYYDTWLGSKSVNQLISGPSGTFIARRELGDPPLTPDVATFAPGRVATPLRAVLIASRPPIRSR